MPKLTLAFILACMLSTMGILTAQQDLELPIRVEVDLSDPLDALAGELITNRKLSPQEFKSAKKKIVLKAKKIFEEKKLPQLLVMHDVKTADELDQKLKATGASLSDTQNQFVWRVFIEELKRM